MATINDKLTPTPVSSQSIGFNVTPMYAKEFGDVFAPQEIVGYEGNIALIFPEDEDLSQYIKFSFYNYKRPDFVRGPKEIESELGTVCLPLTNGLVDGTQINYRDASLGVFGGAAYNTFNTMIGDIKVDQSIPAIISDIATKGAPAAYEQTVNASSIVAGILQGVSQYHNDAGAGISIYGGVTPNPHLATSFEGVSLRTFSFTWKLAPNSEAESKTIAQIIKVFKLASLPHQAGSSYLLGYPVIVKPQIIVQQGDNSLIDIQNSVITRVTVNYTPSNTPAFFFDTSYPAVVEITVDIKETQMITRETFLSSPQT